MKILKIIFINLLILFVLAICLEACLFLSFKKCHPSARYNFKSLSYKDVIKKSFPRSPVGLDYDKPPIILMGCSYIYGLFYENEHTPHYKLSELTKRPVFNYAIPGKGLQHALFVVSNKLYDSRMKKPEYFIYVMMDDHVRRMYTQVMFNDNFAQPVYKIDNFGKITLKNEKFPLYRKFFSVYYFYNLYYFSYFYKNYYVHQKNVFAYFRTMKKLLDKQFPGIKFVILLYDDYNKFGINFSQLEDEGFIVLQTKELTGIRLQQPEYQMSKTDTHPTEAAWDVVIPALVNKLGL